MAEQKELIIHKAKGLKLKDLKLINGASIEISSNQLAILENEPDVLRVDEDEKVNTFGKAKSVQSNQILPWGIDHIDAEMIPINPNINSIKVGIIDTGIDTAHPDLITNIKGGYNAITLKGSYTDDNGHGTHVAGTIAALNNSMGVVGVAPQSSIYSIKALNSGGTGYVSDIIEGIDWAIANKMNVINMSLGLSNDNQSLHDAIERAYHKNITIVAAAGNDAFSTTNYPAAYPEVISVGAIDSKNNVASFVSKGKIDFVAPGVDVYSTFMNSSYQSLSGTSMSAPHISGVVSLMLSTPSKCDLNNDGICSPEEVKQRLVLSARDLGEAGKDDIYGNGLVNAYNAVIK